MDTTQSICILQKVFLFKNKSSKKSPTPQTLIVYTVSLDLFENVPNSHLPFMTSLHVQS